MSLLILLLLLIISNKYMLCPQWHMYIICLNCFIACNCCYCHSNKRFGHDGTSEGRTRILPRWHVFCVLRKIKMTNQNTYTKTPSHPKKWFDLLLVLYVTCARVIHDGTCAILLCTTVSIVFIVIVVLVNTRLIHNGTCI